GCFLQRLTRVLALKDGGASFGGRQGDDEAPVELSSRVSARRHADGELDRRSMNGAVSRQVEGSGPGGRAPHFPDGVIPTLTRELNQAVDDHLRGVDSIQARRAVPASAASPNARTTPVAW